MHGCLIQALPRQDAIPALQIGHNNIIQDNLPDNGMDYYMEGYSFSKKLYQNNLRAVIETQRDDAVPDAAADYHSRVAIRIQPGIIFGEQPLIWGNQSADKGQAELAAVCMAAEDKVNAAGRISLKQLRAVGEQNCVAASTAGQLP